MLSARATLLAVLLSACASTQPLRPWKVELTSGGGITGRGVGTFAVASDEASLCTATPEELAAIERLLVRADRWSESYVPENTCCDRILWTLTIDRAGERRTVRWLDDPPPAPAELDELAALLRGLRCGAASQ